MAKTTETNTGLTFGWADREPGWGADMNTNLARLGAIVQLSVIDQLVAPPATPAMWDRYLVAPAATGAWLGLDQQIVVWDGAAWQAYPASEGWLAFNRAQNALFVKSAAGWDKRLGQVAGWVDPTGTGSRATFDVATATTSDLAARLAQLLLDLKTAGILNG